MIGHNGGPDIDGRRPTLRTLWAKALFEDPDTPSYVMAIAWAIHWYSRKDGTGAALSNDQLCLICGVSEDSATRGKRWLRDHGYVELHVGNGRLKTQFAMRIPTAEEREELRKQREEAQAARVRTQRTLVKPLTAEAAPLPQRTQGPQTAEAGSATSGNVYRNYNQEGFRNNTRTTKRDLNPTVQNPWRQALNPDSAVNPDIVFSGGKITLVNGTRSRWLIEFGDDPKRLDLALTQAANWIQPNTQKPIAMQVEAQLARIAAEKHDKDTRYRAAVKQNQTAGKPKRLSRW